MKPTQDKLRQFVSREVLTCQSSLVEEMFRDEKFNYDDVVNMYQYACRECGHMETDLDKFEETVDEDRRIKSYQCPSCKDILGDIPEQEPQEIFEWWVVTDWLLDRLEEQGEPVLRTDFGNWWGRTCTGQAILLDSVIETIYINLKSQLAIVTHGDRFKDMGDSMEAIKATNKEVTI